MKAFFNILKQSFVSIFNNKARSFLTMLGIAIAVFVVVAVDSIANGLAQNTSSRFSNLDATRITISSQQVLDEPEENNEEESGRNSLRQAFGAGAPIEAGSESLTEEDLAMIIATQNIALASPLVSSQAQVEFTDESRARISISGVNVAYDVLEEFTYAAGSFFSDQHLADAENVVVIDNSLAVGLFDDAASAMDQTIILSDVGYTVVGVLVEPEQQQAGGRGGPGGFGGGQSSSVYVPYTSLMASSESEKIASIIAEAETEDDVAAATESILAALYVSHDITEDTSDVSITTSADALDTISGITAAQSKSDKFIGWIVLVVGGIGIMNIMLVTVSERTKEIGLRKAVGAKNHHIIMQFMTESISLTAIGGGAGLLLAALLSGQVTEIFEIQAGGPGGSTSDTAAIIDSSTIVIALSASILSGLIFGLYPAIKASRKQPVEALRYE